MDVTFKTGNDKFNYRVGAIILKDDKILAVRDSHAPYYYIPGGRVRLHEEAEAGLLRELSEELLITDAEIIRPLWLSQSFFTEDITKERFHELGIYFLVDVSRTNIYSLGESFSIKENENKTLNFEWLSLDRLDKEYFYPVFLKREIFNIPDSIKIITEYQ